MFDLLGIYDIFAPDWWLTEEMGKICSLLPPLCDLGDYLIADAHPLLNNQERMPVYFNHYPSGSSLRSLVYFGQNINAGQFQRYDFGRRGNKDVYGAELPPRIPVENITKVPIAMFVGKSDELADPVDNEVAKREIPSLVFYEEYRLGHLAFMIARDMSWFTEDAMSLLDLYHPATISMTQTKFLS